MSCFPSYSTVTSLGNFFDVAPATAPYVYDTGDGRHFYNLFFAPIASVSPPSIGKVFAPSSIPVNGTSTLTFTISNPNAATAFTGLSFTDNLPSGVAVAATPNATNSCGGTLGGFGNGSTALSLANGMVAAGGTCTISVSVTGTTVGAKNNVTGAVSSAEGGAGNSASATLIVSTVSPPSIGKAFAPSSIPVNGTSTLTFTLGNPNGSTAFTGLAFTDNLPSGVAVAATPNATNSCNGTLGGFGSGSTLLSLVGGTVAAGGTCTIRVSVTGTTAGAKNNVTAAVSSAEGGAGNSASATLTVSAVSPPSIGKAFAPSSIPVNGTSTLTFTISNPNAATAVTGLAFTDNLPSGVAVASNPNATNSCNGTLGGFGPGSTALSLANGTVVADGTCNVSVSVTGTTAGAKNNVTATVSSAEGGAGNIASATLTVSAVSPPSISKAFAPSSILANGTSTLTFTISNPNGATAFSGLAFTDNLPSGVAVATIPNATNSCNGTLGGFGSGSTALSLGSGTVAAGGTCTISVSVTGTTAGAKNNVTAAVSSTEGGAGNSASATLTISAVSPPSISKAFAPSSVPVNGTSTLTFVLSNPNGATAFTGLSFTDSLPPGVAVATTPNATNSCNGTLGGFGTGSTALNLANGTVAANGTCTISVSVTGTTAGAKNNVTTAVSSAEGGAGNSASATLTVSTVSPPSIGKAFAPSSIQVNGTSTLTFTLSNPNGATAFTGLAFTDNLPPGVAVATIPNATNSCNGTLGGFGSGSTALSLAGGTATAGGICMISVNVTGTTAGAKNNVTTAVSSAEGGAGNSASATLTVSAVSPPSIGKAFAPSSIPVNGTSTLTFTISNPNAVTAFTGLAFTDSLPSGVAVASTPNATNSCSGTLSGFGTGSTALSLAAGTMAASGTCAISVSVTGTTAGTKNNVTSAVSSAEGGTGNSASATLTVSTVSPPSIGKAFTPSSIPVNGTSTLTFTISNPNGATAFTGLSFTDSLPPGVAVATTPNATNSCNGTLGGFGSGSTALNLANGTVAANGTCTISVSVTGTTAGAKNNVTAAVSSAEGGTGNSASATLTVSAVSPPSIGKAFAPSSIPVNGTSTLTFTISNPNGATAFTGLAFTDNLPSGVAVAVTPNATNSCSGVINGAAANSSALSLAGGTVAANGTCTISVSVTGTTAGAKNNVTAAVSSAEGGTGNSGSATLTVSAVSPPSISKAFAPSSIPVNGTSTLTFTISNPNGATAFTGLSFTDSLPPGVAVATTPNATNSCNGTLGGFGTGSTALSLAGGTVASSGTCTISVNVTGTTAGAKNNVTAAVNSAEGGAGNNASATLTVSAVSPPSIGKAFTPSSIPVNGTSTLTFTISNPNGTTAFTGLAFTDNLPSGVAVAATPNATNSCNGALGGFGSGSTALNLANGTVAANGTCTISVNVTGTTAGAKNNVTSAVSSAEGGTGNSASATLTVSTVSPPSIGKAFAPSSIPVNGTSTLTFTISNPNTAALSGIAFTDTFPVGLVVADTPGPRNTCGGAPAGYGPGSAMVGLSGGTVPANGTCTFSISVTGTTAGIKNNVTGAVSSSEGGNGNTASATLAVGTLLPASVSKGFSPSSVALGGTSTLTFTITNPNTATLSGIALIDNFPAGLVVSATPSLTNSCAGTITGATANSTAVSLTGGTVAASATCAISVKVSGTTAGTKNNVTGAITSIEGGTGSSASATLAVAAMSPPSLGKTFAPTSIPVNGTSSLTFTIGNPNSTALSGIGFTDNLPTGVVVAATPVLTNTCGGTASGFGGSLTVGLAGGALAAGGSCTVSVTVVGTSAGTKNNVTGAVTSTEGGTGGTASATLTVNVANTSSPSFQKAFAPSSIALNGISTLTFTLGNPNTTALTGIGFTDPFPPGLVVADPPNPRNTCGGAPSGFAPGSTAVSLAGGTLAASGTCTFSISVMGSTAGTKNNVTGAVTSIESGNGNAASATLAVAVGNVSPPSIGKSFAPSTVPLNGASTLTFTITNPNTTALTGIGFTDAFPAGLAVAGTPGLTNTCSGALNGSTPNSTALSLTSGTVAAGGNCSVSISVVGTSAGTKNNVTGAVTSTEGGIGNTGSATLAVAVSTVSPPSIGKAFAPSSIPLNGPSTLTFTIGNPNTTALTGIGFTDNLPTGLVVGATPALTNTCNGTVNGAAPNSNTVSLAGGTLAASGTCTVNISVTATSAGTKNNLTTPVTSTEGGIGNQASATLAVATGNVSPPSIGKAFAPSSIPLNGTSTLTFTIGNLNTTPLTGIAFTDAFPAGLVVADTPNPRNTCGGAPSGYGPGSTAVSLSSATVAGSGTCTFSISVTANTAGTKNNVTGAVTSTEGGNGNTASATLAVAAGNVSPPSIGKAFAPSSVPLNGTSVLTFTLSNPNTTPLTGIGFSDLFPVGLQVAAAPNLTNTCGGAVSGSTPGSVSVSLGNGTIAGGGTCSIRVSVVGTSAGTKNNVTSPVNSIEGGSGNTASAALAVTVGSLLPPTIGKFFAPSSIDLGGTSTLTFTIANPNAAALSGIGFTDVFPLGLVIAATPGLTNTCNGTVNGATANSATVSLSNGSVAASGSCAFSISVVGTSAGAKNNVTGAVTSTEGGTGNTASATLAVATLSPPALSKGFAPPSIPLNGTTTLTFTISNPNPTPLTGVAFTDTFPAGMVVADAPNPRNTCGGSPSGYAPGSSQVSLTGGAVPAGGSCRFTVDVVGTTPGTKNNVTGPITSTESGTGSAASATLTVSP